MSLCVFGIDGSTVIERGPEQKPNSSSLCLHMCESGRRGVYNVRQMCVINTPLVEQDYVWQEALAKEKGVAFKRWDIEKVRFFTCYRLAAYYQ